ncbi:MAG: prepilin-type N-terminal cleavage/methylation domain-containing protein [Clostridia bacterium]|nr:prepilin-type N-terminal cleavage/methylation domain-containing protein [Clostridia bacterium]
MRKNNRKGFTIVELVIVIAVIAILAGVLIPTFAGVATKAKKSAALQEARTIYTEYVAVAAEKDVEVEDCWIKVGTYYVQVANGKLVDTSVTDKTPTGVTSFITAADIETGNVTTETASAE